MKKQIILADTILLNKILIIREQQVMIDRDLAELYNVETKYLKRQVKRNIDRFPEDFMFEMTKEEFEDWRSQFVTSNLSDKMGLRYAPFVFTEQGVAQLSSVLNSKRAISVNIQIIRLFTKMRKMLLTHKDLFLKMEKMEKQLTNQDDKIKLLFDCLKQFINKEIRPREKIGFKFQGTDKQYP